MNCPDYNSPVALKELLDGQGMAMQKRFGQNFLVNGAARRRIADALGISAGTTVWEVGPGLGAMTAELLSRGARVTAFEIDRGFARLLRSIFSEEVGSGTLRIVEGDAMRTWRGELESSGVPERFFGNLPYNVAAQIVGGTIEAGVRFGRMVVTVQREVAERMAADAGGAEYSSLSVLCRWAYDVSTVADLAGGSFWPVPNVASRTVSLVPRDGFPGCSDPSFFRAMVRRLFSSRRKTVRNNLLSLAGAGAVDAALAAAGVSPGERAERLGVGALLSLSDALSASRG